MEKSFNPSETLDIISFFLDFGCKNSGFFLYNFRSFSLYFDNLKKYDFSFNVITGFL